LSPKTATVAEKCGCAENGGPEIGGPENAGPTTGMENAGTNNYAEYNMYNHSQLLKAAFAGYY